MHFYIAGSGHYYSCGKFLLRQTTSSEVSYKPCLALFQYLPFHSKLPSQKSKAEPIFP